MYTKGEWTVEVYDDYTNVEAEHQTICTDVSNCDAQLIAAAPDMYEALKEVLASMVCNDDMSISYAIDGLTRCAIDNALAKAGG